MITLSRLLCLVTALSMSVAHGQAPATAEPTPVSDKGFPGYVVEEVVVPVPSEIFAVLDKLGDPNWSQELKGVVSADSTDRTQLSLIFGTVVAEGFLAVQAQDKKAVEDVGKEVLSLATKLAIKPAVQQHANAIIEAADKGDWSAIRREFDLTQKTVRDTMEKNKDNDLAQCVSLGGWLRGTAVVTAVVGKAFSADRAELLQQPMLVEHFIQQTSKMSETVKNHPTVKATTEGLATIKATMDKSTDGFTADGVTSIDATTQGLIGLIKGKSTK
jgi:hypothetical protein